MEQYKEKLYKLLNEELSDLSIGYPYNLKRISLMQEICHLIMYYKYVDISDSDIMKIVNFYG